MDKLLLAKKVVANVMDFDLHNLIGPRSLLDEMQDAYEGGYEVLPRKTLRERQYINPPLMIRPDYSGDFLKKLEEPLEGKPVEVESADEENLKDFSMPSEMLKHQEEPHPRVLLDDYYETSRPGDQAGGDDLKDYWDRGWDNTDSPEMSEDKWLRMWTIPNETNKTASIVVASYMAELLEGDDTLSPSKIVSAYLMDRFPLEGLLDLRKPKVAKLLSDFQRSLIHGKNKLDTSGVTARLIRAEPRSGRWTFATTSGKERHTTIFQFIPHSVVRDTNKLHVRVSCSCPSWLFWGAQYHAVMGDYLYGKIRPKFSPPRKRDPEGSFLVCKHVLACIPIVSKYKLAEIPAELKEKIKKAPRYEVEKEVPKEKLKIPKELIGVGKRPKMKKIVELWDEKPKARRRMVQDLVNPEEVAFLAHRFPSTATALVAERLKQISSERPGLKKKSMKLLDGVEEIAGKEPVKEVAIPTELKKFENMPSFKKELEELNLKDPKMVKRMVMGKKDPDMIAFLAYKYHTDSQLVSYAIEKLNDIIKETKSPREKNKAETWLKSIIG